MRQLDENASMASKFLCPIPGFLRFVKGSINEIDITELDRPIFHYIRSV